MLKQAHILIKETGKRVASAEDNCDSLSNSRAAGCEVSVKTDEQMVFHCVDSQVSF